MGLLSGSTFRGIVGGIASAYVDRREEAKDKISEFQERVRNRVDKVNKKKEDVFNEFETDIKSYNAVLQTAGSNLKPQLDTLLMTNPDDLSALLNLDQNQIKNRLNSVKVSDEVEDFSQTRKDAYKIKSDNLTQSLQDEVGIFKNQGTLFTKGLYERETPTVQAITETVDDTRPLPRVGTALPEGLPLGQTAAFTGDAKIKSLQTFKELYYNPPVTANDTFQKPTLTTDKGFNFIQDLEKDYNSLVQRGYQGNLEDFFAEYQFDVDQKALNRTFTPSYTKFDGDFAPNSKFDSNLTSAFTNALEAEDYDGAKEIIEGYQSSSFEGNNAKAKTLNEQLDNAIKGITDTAPDDEKETTSVEQLRDVGPRPPLGGGAKGKEKRDNWDANYGNLLFRDGTIITDAQKQYILENPRASKDLFVKTKIDQENYKSLNNL
jgi:hypothetical protein